MNLTLTPVDIFHIVLAILLGSLIIYGYRVPLDDMDKELLKEKK